MKKIIFAIIATATIAYSQDVDDQFALLKKVRADFEAARTNSSVYAEYMTAEKWQEYMHQVCESNRLAIAATGRSNDSLLAHPTVLWPLYHKWYFPVEGEDKATYAAKWDNELAESGFGYLDPNIFFMYPKVTANFFARRPDWVANHPVQYGIIVRNPTNHYTNVEQINIFVEKMSLGEHTQNSIAASIKRLAGLLSAPVKRYLREHGKTFVVGEDEKNPVQEIIDEFMVAIQSSKCTGVKEFCAKYLGYNDWIDVHDEDYEDLKDKVFYGEEPLNNKNAVKLQYFLGIDAYNAFIDAYNNDAN